MPQLDPSFFISQLFWLVIIFSMIFFIVTKLISPKMQRIFSERENTISNSVKSAEIAKNEALQIESEYNQKLAHARKSSAIKIYEVQNEIASESKKKIEELEAEIKKLVQKSESEIEDFKILAKEELKKVVLDSVKIAVKDFSKISVEDESLNFVIKERFQ